VIELATRRNLDKRHGCASRLHVFVGACLIQLAELKNELELFYMKEQILDAKRKLLLNNTTVNGLEQFFSQNRSRLISRFAGADPLIFTFENREYFCDRQVGRRIM
jgi:hypothetical protein